MKIAKYSGRGLSRFRTFHNAAFYAQIESESDVAPAFYAARMAGKKICALGGGSNIFFKRANIASAVLKNALPQSIKELGGDLYEVSSSVGMLKMLEYARERSLDCFYYLASAPCQIGGAIAMNAGSGKKEALSISDFIESVKFFDGEKFSEKTKSEIFFDYRNSEFLRKPTFILSAVFRFPRKKIEGNPVRERLEWAAQRQDLSLPNCGSMCNKYSAGILKFARFIFALAPAGLSKKKLNWAVNKARSPIWLRALFGFIRILHAALGKRLKFEIRMFD